MKELPEGLLDLVKNYLNYTWLDNATELKLTLIINNAIVDLDDKSGMKNDYMISGRAQSLLLNRVMYEMSGALDDFYINYKKEIVAFINKARVTNAKGKENKSM